MFDLFFVAVHSAVDHDRMMFARFFTLMKKHHMLALLSILRLHKVQAMMNLRQVLEAGAAAAFAVANREQHHFAETDEQGLLDPSQELTKKRTNGCTNTINRDRTGSRVQRNELICQRLMLIS